MSRYYRLDEQNKPVPCGLMDWGRATEIGQKRVALDESDDVQVSTVFLGLDHSFGGPVPVLWETMIFGGEHDQYCDRYTSHTDALEGHKKACALAGIK